MKKPKDEIAKLKQDLSKHEKPPIYSEASAPWESLAYVYSVGKDIVHPAYITDVINSQYSGRKKFKPVERKRIINAALDKEIEESSEYYSGRSETVRFPETMQGAFNISKLVDSELNNSEISLLEKLWSIEDKVKTAFEYWDDAKIEILRDYAQKKVILSYKGNQLFSKVLQKNTTLEEIAAGLSQVNKGIRYFLPHRKNKEHNQKVKALGELVPNAYNYRTNGFFYPDNYITMHLYSALTIGAACAGTLQLLTPHTFWESMRSLGLSAGVLLYYVTATPLASLRFTNDCRGPFIQRNKDTPITYARDIDNKVKELFH
jgi:hypothetical protein